MARAARSSEEDAGHAAAVNFLNGRVMAIAGGSNQIQRNSVLPCGVAAIASAAGYSSAIDQIPSR